MRTARRQGFALAVAILAIVVIGALVACATFVSMQEYRIGRNLLAEQRAFVVAEKGLNGVVAPWGGAGAGVPLAAMAVGEPSSYTVSATSGDRAVVRLTRVTDSTFWAVSEGTAAPGDVRLRSTRRTSLILRLGADGALRPVTQRSWAQLF